VALAAFLRFIPLFLVPPAFSYSLLSLPYLVAIPVSNPLAQVFQGTSGAGLPACVVLLLVLQSVVTKFVIK